MVEKIIGNVFWVVFQLFFRFRSFGRRLIDVIDACTRPNFTRAIRHPTTSNGWRWWSQRFVQYSRCTSWCWICRSAKCECLTSYWIKVMKIETTSLTSLPLCLPMVGIRTREIPVQIRDRNLCTTNRFKNLVCLFLIYNRREKIIFVKLLVLLKPYAERSVNTTENWSQNWYSGLLHTVWLHYYKRKIIKNTSSKLCRNYCFSSFDFCRFKAKCHVFSTITPKLIFCFCLIFSDLFTSI